MLTRRASSCGLEKLMLQPVLETGALAALELQPPAVPGQRKILGRPLQSVGGGQLPRDTRFGRVPWQGGEGVGAG